MAKTLKDYRKEVKMSRQQLAVAVNIGYSTICRYEQHKAEMKSSYARKFAKYFADTWSYDEDTVLNNLVKSHSRTGG